MKKQINHKLKIGKLIYASLALSQLVGFQTNAFNRLSQEEIPVKGGSITAIKPFIIESDPPGYIPDIIYPWSKLPYKSSKQPEPMGMSLEKLKKQKKYEKHIKKAKKRQKIGQGFKFTAKKVLKPLTIPFTMLAKLLPDPVSKTVLTGAAKLLPKGVHSIGTMIENGGLKREQITQREKQPSKFSNSLIQEIEHLTQENKNLYQKWNKKNKGTLKNKITDKLHITNKGKRLEKVRNKYSSMIKNNNQQIDKLMNMRKNTMSFKQYKHTYQS